MTIFLLCTLLKLVYASCTPIYTKTFASLTLTILPDGPIKLPSTPPPFDVPSAALNRSYRLNFRGTDPIVWGQNVALLDTPKARILVDAGSANLQWLPSLEEGGRLPVLLEKVGVERNSIDAVVLTHAHFDHVGGLLTPQGSVMFPNADVLIGRKEHEFWSARPLGQLNPNVPNETIAAISDFYLQSVAPYGDRLKLVNDKETPVDGVTFLSTPGHSPGHMSFEVDTGEGKIVLAGDAWVSAPDQLQNPTWSFYIESNRDVAFKSRIDLLERMAQRRELTMAFHENFPGLGIVSQSRAGFSWIPLSGEDGYDCIE